jgi:RecJ-like exonuclease
MGDSAKLVPALKPFCEKLRAVVEGGSEISVITHLDADGITSGSIMATALARMGARCSVRTVSDMNPGVIERMKAEARDFYVITDLGGGMAAQFRKALGDRWVVIDHHQIPEEEMTTDDAGQVMNAWKFGIDGGTEVPAGGMAYMVASALDRKNRDLSCIAVVSAVGDRQDQGDKKSFLGVNKEILETAKSMGLVNVDLDIMLTGRETRPLHEALAFTSFPFIDGLTWNRDNCYNALKNANIKLKDNGNRWRVPAEFSQEEKSSILEAIAKFVVTSSKTSASVIDDLIGNVYTLAAEDKRSQLRDAREFATLLNACGRIGRSGVGVAICMGDRNAMLSAGEEINGEYRTTLRNYISTIFNEKWRVSDDGKVALVNGDGLVAEDMLGAVSSLLAGSQNLAGRLVFVRSLAGDTYKFSSRKGLGSASKANLGLIMRHCAESVKGTGGGHAAAAGCRIPSSALDDFIAYLRSAINDEKFATAA